MTRRERLEAKVEKRHEWAEKAEDRGEALLEQGHKMFDVIPFGQPVLVGHHSEGTDRNYRSRASNKLHKGVEELKLAEHHESKAHGLEIQLEKTIFSDDENAIAALETRIAEREAKAAEMVATNKAWRKSKGSPIVFAQLTGFSLETCERIAASIAQAYSWEKQPFASWQLTNLRATIRTDKQRIDEIKARAAKTAKAEAAGGVLVQVHAPDQFSGVVHVSVTFAEKPDRSIINALKAAGFRWYAPVWYGEQGKLPEGI